MKIAAVAAMAENRVIGKDNQLPWHLPEDLKRFKQVTLGHPVIMGRKTFDSMGKPLPKRVNLVITRQEGHMIDGAQVFNSLDRAIEWCRSKIATQDEEIFVIGGAELWRAAWPELDRIYLTVIHKEFEGDTYFPEFDWNDWEVTFKENHSDPIPYTFYTLDRKLVGA